jgi:8-oxo-dGTP pyrophosphatase MutT (NUDIX family)
MVAVPKYASTVILYRLVPAKETTPCGFEIFLIQRAKELKFLGGFHAFPGGKLEPDDYSAQSIARCNGVGKSHAHEVIQDNMTSEHSKDVSLGFWTAGIRELFEEVGILLAYDETGHLPDLSDPKVQGKFQTYQKRLIKKELLFREILEREDLFYATDLLHYFRHFITPDLSPIRYDTRFFLAELPPNQPINLHLGEITSAEWQPPASFLNQYRKREIKLIPPQYACISKLKKVTDIKHFCDSLT